MKLFLCATFLFILASKCLTQPVHPDWVKDAVFYQIFPERFSNGDASNDPDLASLSGSWPHDTSEWQISPWTSDWYKLQPWEVKNGRGFGFNAQRRRYGGDIQGIIDKLDYLADLGINTIYLNPVFNSPSLHKYDGATYHHIDVHFGPNPEGDKKIINNEDPLDVPNWSWTSADRLFLELITKAHGKGIKIIIDGVFNHTGINFFAFKDVRENGEKSAFKDWYTITAWDDPQTAANEFKYHGWAGVKELPELSEDENGLIEPVKKYVFDAVQRWMDPNGDGDPSDGIDGWRLDVAEKVNHNFWKVFRNHVKSINPEAYITGEIFWEDWANNKLMDPAPWLKGDQFDGVMNYRWSNLMSEYFINRVKKISAENFANRLLSLDKSYHPETRFQLLNLMDSHDTDRLSSHIVNPDIFYDKMVNIHDNPYYNVRKPRDEEWSVFKLIVTVQFTFPGAPMMYYGSEAGMWGADDPDERKPMVWPDKMYEVEVANISKTERPPDSVYFNTDLHQFYKKVILLRQKEAALRRGSFNIVYVSDSRDVIAYLREFKDQKILCVINNSPVIQKLNFDDYQKGKELLSQKEINLTSFYMESKSCFIIKLV